MQDDSTAAESEVQKLKNQVRALERQLSAAQQQAAQRLSESEERFSKAFQAHPDALVISRLDDGRIIEVNQSFEQLFGFSRAEVIGKSSLELDLFMSPADRQKAIEQLRQQGSVRGFHLDIRTRRGESRPARLFIERISIHSEDHLLTILQDLSERKWAEASLRESEQRYSALFQARTNAIAHCRVITDEQGQPIDYEILQVNEAFEQITGIQRADIEGRLAREVFPGIENFSFDYIGSYGRVALQGGELNFEAYFEPLRQWQSIYTYSPKPGEFTVLFSNVTQRKQTEALLKERSQEVQESEAMLRLALAAGRAGAWSWDLRTNALQWSDEYYKIFGYAPGSLQPSAEAGFRPIHPEDRPRIENAVRQAIEQGKPIDVVHRVIWSDGSLHWVRGISQAFYDEQGQPERIAGIAMDVTRQMQAEIELQAAHHQTSEILESIQDAFYSLDPQSRFTYVNRKAASMWGKQPADLLGKNIWEVFPSGKETESYTKIQQALLERQPIRYESYSKFLDQWIEVHIYPTEKGISVYFQDISERKRAQEALVEFTRRLERSNQDLEQFAYIASHDLQEPLRKIEFFCAALLNTAEPVDDTQQAYVERMHQAAGRMRAMVNGLLQLSRIHTQGQPFIEIDLSKTVAEVLNDLELLVRRTGGRVEVARLPQVEGDPVQLHQLLLNVIGNALKYHRPDVPPLVKVYARQLPASVQIVVEDNGIGFPAEAAEQMFLPFKRLVGRSEYEGSGIGLAICRRIVERHNGEISATGEPGRGAAFYITLPDGKPGQ